MKKFAITIGETVDGKLEVLDGPSSDVDAIKNNLQALTTAGGKREKKKAIQHAVILHSQKGVIKRRRGLG